MTKEQIIELYQEGQSISALARMQTDFTYGAIQKILRENQIPIRGGRKKKELTPEQIEELRVRYCENSENLRDLAKEFKLDATTLKCRFEELGFKKKSNNKINKRIKSDYFSVIDTEEKAYWLGMLFTDGSVDENRKNVKRIRLQLQADDKEILEKFKTALQIDSKLILDPRGKGCYSVEFSDAQIFDDLAKYNIIPQKTYKVEHLPNNIPEQFLPAFARGLFDGDGCLTYSQDMVTDVTFGFTSFHESVVKDFQILIDDLIGKWKSNKLIYTSCWHAHWRGYQQVIEILDILYKDATIYLERKYNKYIKLKNRNVQKI